MAHNFAAEHTHLSCRSSQACTAIAGSSLVALLDYQQMVLSDIAVPFPMTDSRTVRSVDNMVSKDWSSSDRHSCSTMVAYSGPDLAADSGSRANSPSIHSRCMPSSVLAVDSIQRPR